MQHFIAAGIYTSSYKVLHLATQQILPNPIARPNYRLEPIMLKNLPIIPSRSSQKFYPLFLIYSQIIIYYSFIILLLLLSQ